jgi:hypothetical protein
MLYEPGYTFTKDYVISKYRYDAQPYVTGDWREFAEITDLQEYDTYKTFRVRITLPEEGEEGEAGVHSILVGAGEVPPPGAGIVALAKAQKMMNFLVLYDEKIAKFEELITPNVNENEKTNFYFTAESLSKQNITGIHGEIKIYNYDRELVKTLIINSFDLASAEQKTVFVEFDSQGVVPGQFYAEAIVSWENMSTTLENTFNVGTLHLEIVGFTKNFTAGHINKIDINVESKWNGGTTFYAELFIDDEEQTKTQTYTIGPFEIITITGFLDLTYVESGEHDLRIVLKYGDEETVLEEKIQVLGEAKEKPREPISITLTATEIMMILVILVLILIIFLMFQKSKKKSTEKKSE